jgi:hypothetical protein
MVLVLYLTHVLVTIAVFSVSLIKPKGMYKVISH